MRYDVMLFSFPNKNMDYPGLALPTLTAHLRENGHQTFQEDSNVIIRDMMMTESFLTNLTNTILPYIHSQNTNDFKISNRIKSIIDFLNVVDEQYGFDSIEQTKQKMQARMYSEILTGEESFKLVSTVFKISRSFHNVIDMLLHYDYLLDDCGISNPIEEYLVSIEEMIDKNNPVAVGFTVLNIQRKFTAYFAKRLREKYDGIIFVGGADPTNFGKHYLKYFPSIDVAFIKESEENLSKFIEKLKNNDFNYSDIPGIIYRINDVIKDNEIQFINPRNMLVPDFDGLAIDKYLTNVLPIQASRGCCWGKCKFCIHWKTYYKYYHKRPVDVVREIETLSNKYDTPYFHFTDDALEMKFGSEICREIVGKKINVRWLTYARFDTGFSKDVLDLWKKAGASVIEWGFESASKNVLKLMNKDVDPNVAEKIINDSSDAGITNKLFMFHGYPSETISDLTETIDFIERNIRSERIRFFMPIRNKFELLKGSKIYDDVLKHPTTFFKKVWIPSGAFSIHTEYFDLSNYVQKKIILGEFFESMDKYMKEKNIYTTNDENITLDIIYNHLNEQGILMPFNQV